MKHLPALLVAAALCACSSTDDEPLLTPRSHAGSAGSAQAGESAGGGAGEAQAGSGDQGGTSASVGGAQAGGGTAAGGSGAASGAGGVGTFDTGDGCLDYCKLLAACAGVTDAYCALYCPHARTIAGDDCYNAYKAALGCVAADIGADCKLSGLDVCPSEKAKQLEVCGNDCSVKLDLTTTGQKPCTESTACGPTSLKASCDGSQCTCERNGVQVGMCEASPGSQDKCNLDSGCCAEFFY